MTEKKTKKQQKANVPNLRFPGFRDEWREEYLSDVADIARGKSKHRPRDAAFLFNGQYPFIQTGDVKAAGLYLDTYKQTYSEAGLKQSKLWDEDTLCITIAANIAETTILKIKACFPDSIIGLIPKENKSTVVFIKYQFDKFKAEVQKLSEGIAQANLNLEKLITLKFTFPSLKEQTKIANFLAVVERRIETQNKIIERLETLITGLRDSLFNHKIRFRGFNQPWEKFRGSDLLIFFPTNSLSWENLEYASGTILNLHYGLIHQGLPQQINLTENKLPSIKNECLPVNYELCKEGDVVFADASEDTNDVGKVIEFIDCNEKLVVSGLHTIHGRDKLNRSIVGFKGYAFSAKSFRNQMRSLAQGTKVYSISIKNFHDCFISIPEKEEQQKIIKILTNISHQIADEKKILKAFKVQKEFLIQKMFI